MEIGFQVKCRKPVLWNCLSISQVNLFVLDEEVWGFLLIQIYLYFKSFKILFLGNKLDWLFLGNLSFKLIRSQFSSAHFFLM